MTGRPDLAVMEAVLLDERGRLRPGARRMVVEEFRCRRRERHLQGAVLRTPHGLLVMRRAEVRPGAPQWLLDWLGDLPGDVLMTCHCRRLPRSVDLSAHRDVR
jgi:hypothetical protein